MFLHANPDAFQWAWDVSSYLQPSLLTSKLRRLRLDLSF